MGLGWARRRRLEMGRVVRTRWILVSEAVWPLDALAKSDLGRGRYGFARDRNAPGVCVYGVDSPIFDARVYYEQLITTSSLPTLMKTENDLLTGASSLRLRTRQVSDHLSASRNTTTRQRTTKFGLQPSPRTHRR